MSSFLLYINASSTYTTDAPILEVLVDGLVVSTLTIDSGYLPYSFSLDYAGSFPSSLEFRFDDGLSEPSRNVSITSVFINGQTVDHSYISQLSLNQGDTSSVTTSSVQTFFGDVDLNAGDLDPVTITGTAAADVLKGTTGDDVIDGLDGNDVIKANAGHDQIVAGLGDDLVRGSTGNDIILGGDGNDKLLGEDDNDELYGGAGTDNLEGGAGNDFLSGGTDNDILRGGDGADTLLGGAGNDVLRGEGGNDHITGGLGLDLLEGGDGDDSLSGGGDNDTLRGGLGVDRLYGDAGNDRLFGDDGNDKLYGGEGNDLIEGGAGQDDIFGGDGNDRIRAGDDNDDIEGEGGNDNINGGSGRDTINGGLGLDRIEGDDGDDTIHGNEDNDTVLGGAGNDYVYGDDGNDRVRGGDNNDFVYGGEGNDQVFGDAGDDTVYGGNGNDLVNGNEGNDTLYGEDGFDKMFGHEGNDTIYGGLGNDRIYGNEGIDDIYGEDGDDRLEAGDDADTVDGGAGLDTILGGGGDDVLNGGADNDVIYATGTAWYDGGWEYRQLITINSSQVTSDLIDYTITIDGSGFGSDFWDNVDTFGRDILFTADDKVTELSRELYSIDTATQTLEVHVNVPDISSSVDTELYMYWGNASANLTDDADTWADEYGGVWHLGNQFNQFTQVFDEADGNYGAGRSGLDDADIVASQFGQGYQFNASEYVALNKSYTSAGELPAVSVSAWVNTTFSGTGYNQNWAILDFDRSEFFNVFVDGATGQLSFSTNVGSTIDDFSGGPAINDGGWHHVVAVYDGTDKILYVDGVEVARDVNTHGGQALGENITRFGFIGDGSEADGFDGSRNNIGYDGQLDELRLYEGALTADEIATQYNNQNNPSNFYTVGDVKHNDDGVDSDILNGGDGNDTLYGSSGGDTLNGDAGNDTLYGSTGNDILSGGDHNDIIYADAYAAGDTTVNITSPPPASNGPFGEVGTISGATQTGSTQWHSISFTETLLNPIVKMTANTQNGDPFTLRVRNVTNTGFEWQIDEFAYQDGVHATAEDISWIAINEGTHTLDNGQVIQAGTVDIQNETQNTVSFHSNFTSSPIVFSQIMTDNDPNANVTRQRNVTNGSFNVQMQGEEALDNTIQQETVGWIAIDIGGSVSDGIVSNITGNSVTHADTNVIFGGNFASGNPAFFADMQTIDGGDTAYTSGTNITATDATVSIEEEQSANAEVNHTTENVGYLAVEEGVLENAGGGGGGGGGGGSTVDDTLYGGDGFDQLFGGFGRDSFVFGSASAFNDVDEINFFSYNDQDALDISDLLVGYTDGVSDINDFVSITEVGGDTIVSVDANGTTGGSSYLDIAQLNDVTGLTVDAMYANQSLIT